jgi:hypothetical protein
MKLKALVVLVLGAFFRTLAAAVLCVVTLFGITYGVINTNSTLAAANSVVTYIQELERPKPLPKAKLYRYIDEGANVVCYELHAGSSQVQLSCMPIGTVIPGVRR